MTFGDDLFEESRVSARRFLAREAPRERLLEEPLPAAPPAEGFWQRASELGWCAALVPEELGGFRGEDSIRLLAGAVVELGVAAAPGALISTSVVADVLARRGGEAQRDEYLPGILDGSVRVTWALCEADDGWLAPGRGFTVKADANGDLLLDGVKLAVEDAGVADVLLVTAWLGDEPAHLLVPASAAGVSVDSEPSLDATRHYSRVTFDSTPAPRSWLLGDAEHARAELDRMVSLAVALTCAETVHVVDRALSLTLEYMQDRYSFGRPIASYQALKHRVADHKVWLEAAFGVTDALLDAVGAEQEGPEVAQLTSIAKAHVGDASMTILSDCAQLLGGIAMTAEHEWHLAMRRASVNRVLWGSPVQHRDRLFELMGG